MWRQSKWSFPHQLWAIQILFNFYFFLILWDKPYYIAVIGIDKNMTYKHLRMSRTKS